MGLSQRHRGKLVLASSFVQLCYPQINFEKQRVRRVHMQGRLSPWDTWTELCASTRVLPIGLESTEQITAVQVETKSWFLICLWGGIILLPMLAKKGFLHLQVLKRLALSLCQWGLCSFRQFFIVNVVSVQFNSWRFATKRCCFHSQEVWNLLQSSKGDTVSTQQKWSSNSTFPKPLYCSLLLDKLFLNKCLLSHR